MDTYIIFIITFMAVAVIDIIVAVMSGLKKNVLGYYLSIACASAVVVDVSYVLSVLTPNYFMTSLLSSIYFASIDVMLVCIVMFIRHFTKQATFLNFRYGKMLVFGYMIFDIAVLMINPFYEITMHYVWHGTAIAGYTYDMMLLYKLHLLYTYILVAIVIFFLIRKLLHVPQGYKDQYLNALICILVIVGANAVFLVMQKTSNSAAKAGFLDYSILFYSLAAFFLYWNSFNYSSHGMLNHFRSQVFENVSQGIVLFDYEENLLVHNERANKLLANVRLHKDMHLKDFLTQCGIQIADEMKDESYSFQCFVKDGDRSIPLRCDYRPMKNKKDSVTGRMFVFSDASQESDLLTGFRSWESFRKDIRDGSIQINASRPMNVAICDINGLSNINAVWGRNVGDQAILALANLVRDIFPKDTYFVRGQEASLFAICYYVTEEQVQEYLLQVQERFEKISYYGVTMNLQWAISSITENDQEIMNAFRDASKAIRTKKLMDQRSRHSNFLTSLIRALQECDHDTEAHVQRTRKMGAALGRQIGLSDVQQSDLSLLCLLHDIGKIGIPLEILNKPGKLTDTEYRILQSHVEKGYQIANSSQELQGIAEDIRHHHEWWDGSGYPDGISKESIPLLSRVIAVVDAYDAMVNDRSYRAAMSPESAQKELKRCAGTQFDPAIVSEFIRMLKSETPQSVQEEELETEDIFSEIKETDREKEEPVNDNKFIHTVKYSRYILDEALQIVLADENFERMTGYSPEEIKRQKLGQADLIFPEDRPEYLRMLNEQISHTQRAYFEHRIRRKNGSVLYVFCYGKQYYDSAERAIWMECVITDSTDTYSMQIMAVEEKTKARKLLERWESKYRCDALTGLLTHEALKNDVEMQLLAGKRNAVMLMMDVDKFKKYNDTYGHRAGDEFLIMIAQAIKSSLRKGDLACRMGGDEFAAVLFVERNMDETGKVELAQQVFDRINLRLISAQGGTSLSMGVAISSRELQTFNQLYEAADRALYVSKKKGSACLSVYEHEK